MQHISEKFLSDGTFFHWSFSLLLVFNPRVSARYLRFFVHVKCRHKIKLFTKNRSNLDLIRVRRLKQVFFFVLNFIKCSMIENDYHLYTTSSSINNYFNHKIQSKFLSDKKKTNKIIQNMSKKKIFFFSICFSDFLCRTKALFHLMTYFCYVKYVTTALIKEAR